MTGKFIMFGAVGSATAVSRPSLIPSHDARRGACHSAFRDVTPLADSRVNSKVRGYSAHTISPQHAYRAQRLGNDMYRMLLDEALVRRRLFERLFVGRSFTLITLHFLANRPFIAPLNLNGLLGF